MMTAPGNWYAGVLYSHSRIPIPTPSKILLCTAAYRHRNVPRLPGLCFWIDGKGSVFIVNFLDRIQEKAGWKAWKGNRRRKHDVVMGLYPASEEPRQNPIKILLQLWPFAFPCTFTCFFLTYDWGNLRQECFSFHISKKIFIYLYVWPAIE